MKACPVCSRSYTDETLNFCLDDGAWLGTGEPATAIFNSAESAGESPTRISLGGSARGNLPSERTRFIGRTHELSECLALLGSTRLLTLTGFGGCGKTRLALKLAERLSNDFPDGAWFVDLAPVTEPGMVVSVVAESLSLREEAGKQPIESLLHGISANKVIVVLDNCEHLLSACAELSDRLLDRCSRLHIIATSREPLGVPGETVFALRSLSMPDAEQSFDHTSSDAVELFIDRARLSQTAFELTPDNFEAVADISRRLDGIPLAIELAAARLKVLSVDQIRGMLSERFKLLSTPGKTVVPRHQTLQAAMQWSYDPLSDEEKRLLRLLSVFAGGWDLRLVGEVAGGRDEFEMLDLLSRLIDKSLVIVEQNGGAKKRYTLLETVRQFAYDLLVENGEVDAARRAHMEAMLALAERAYAGHVTGEEEWSHVLEAETDNLRSALEFARDRDAEKYLTFAGSLGWFWLGRSHIFEGREHLTAALAGSPTEPPRPARARALWGAANILAWQGDAAGAHAYMDEALATWRALGDTPEIALALEGIGWSQFFNSEDEAACTSFEECLRIQRAAGDPALINRAMVGLAQVLVALDRTEEARSMAGQILEFSRTHNDKRSEHFGWHYLADCALIEENYAESLRLYKQSLALANALGDKIETAFEVQGVAMSLSALGRSKEAITLFAAVHAELNRLGADINVRFWNALIDKYTTLAQQTLGPTTHQTTWTRSLTLPFDQAVTLAANA